MPTFSFELYPPRNAAADTALLDALQPLVDSGPEFISVTYGASGSEGGASIAVLRSLLESGVSPMAHFTCVNAAIDVVSRRIREFLDSGVTSFLALRGDPPAGTPEGADFLGDIRSAAELVQLIHHVRAEREPFREEAIPGFPDARRLRPGDRVTVAVAAFPNGHPRSSSIEQDLDTLLAKEAAGANLAITQLFFHAEEYLRFVDQARSAGVTMRILPGIMPVLSERRLHRILELTGEDTPRSLLSALRGQESAKGQHAVGLDYATALCAELLDGGAPGLHLYTFNQYQPVLAILRDLGLTHPKKEPAWQPPRPSRTAPFSDTRASVAAAN